MFLLIRLIGILFFIIECFGWWLFKIIICFVFLEKVFVILELVFCVDNELGRENIMVLVRVEIGNSFMCVFEFMFLVIIFYCYIGR